MLIGLEFGVLVVILYMQSILNFPRRGAHSLATTFSLSGPHLKLAQIIIGSKARDELEKKEILSQSLRQA